MSETIISSEIGIMSEAVILKTQQQLNNEYITYIPGNLMTSKTAIMSEAVILKL